MSKISEQKALEAYPKALSPYYGDDILDRNINCRAGYVKGYDTAMQDLLERAEKFFNNELYVSVSDQICSQSDFTSITKFFEQFKNHIENEM